MSLSYLVFYLFPFSLDEPIFFQLIKFEFLHEMKITHISHVSNFTTVLISNEGFMGGFLLFFGTFRGILFSSSYSINIISLTNEGVFIL